MAQQSAAYEFQMIRGANVNRCVRSASPPVTTGDAGFISCGQPGSHLYFHNLESCPDGSPGLFIGCWKMKMELPFHASGKDQISDGGY